MTEASVAPANSRRLKVLAYCSYPLLMLVSALLAIPLALYIFATGADATKIPIMLALALTIVAEVGVLALVLGVAGEFKNAREILGLKNFKVKTVLLGMGVGVIGIVVLQALGVFLKLVGLGFESSDTTTEIGGVSGSTRLLVLLFLVPVVVPFLEELFFRGYVLGFLRRAHGVEHEGTKNRQVKWAIFWAGAFFGLAHFQGLSSPTDLMVVLWTGTFGVLNGILRVKSDSLYPAIASHMTYNFITTLFILAAI